MPLGLMDNWWYEDGYSECGNNNLILEFLDRPKTKLVYCNFGIGTNPSETNKCKNVAQSIGIPYLGTGIACKSYKDYLEELSQHKYCLCPNGNGIDTHRLWESLYLGVSPIVTKSINIMNLNLKSAIILDTWDDLKNENFELDLRL